MKEIFESVAGTLGFIFEYARRDHQNLFDDISNDLIPHFFLDPIKTEEKFDEMNVLEKTIYSGSFMLMVSSDLDEEDYDFRYKNYIKPLKDIHIKAFRNQLDCNYDFTFLGWSFTEIINVFDQNLDGLLVLYSIEVEE